jgi:plasmid stabilization system protein ParE
VKVRLSHLAELDFLAILEFIERANRSAALRFGERIQHRFEMLEQNPEHGEACSDFASGRMRRTIVKPYVIYYEIRPRQIEILRILHGAVEYGRLFEPGEDE